MKIGLLDTGLEKEIRKEIKNNNERYLGKIERHYMFIVRATFIESFLFIFYGVVVYYLLFLFIPNFAKYLLWFSLIILFLRIMNALIDYKYDYLIASNYRIFIVDNNFIFHNIFRPISFDQIEEITFDRKGIFQTIFNFGRVEISIKGKGANNMFKFNFAKADISKKVIDKLSESHAEILKGRKSVPVHVEADHSHKSILRKRSKIQRIDDDITDKLADILE